MTWYYALGNERQGPIDDAALDRLIATGVVTQDTLVWKAGMADWQPLAQARPRAAAPPTPVIPPPPAVITPAPAAGAPDTQPRFGTPTRRDASAGAGAYGAAGSGRGAGGGAAAGAQAAVARVPETRTSSTRGSSASAAHSPSARSSAAPGSWSWTTSAWPSVPARSCYLPVVAGVIPCLGILIALGVNADPEGGPA